MGNSSLSTMSSMPPFMVRKTSVVILCTILTCIHLYFLITGQAVLPESDKHQWWHKIASIAIQVLCISINILVIIGHVTGVARLLLPWLPYGYISLLIGFWSILNPEKGIVPTFWTHLRVPAAFMGLVAMMCTIRLFYWAYLDMVDPDDDIQTTVELPMNVSKIQLPSTSPQIGSEHPSLSVERLYHNTDSFQESSISQKDQHPLHICPVVTITDGLNSNSNSSFDESPPHSSCEKDPRTPWMVHPKKRKNLRRGSCSSEGYCTGETSAVFSCNTAITDVSPCKED